MPPDPEDPDERALGELVLGCLDEHPHAMETLDGVAEWWIERRRIRVSVEALSRALTHLTETGALEVVGSGPTRRYRLKTPDVTAPDVNSPARPKDARDALLPVHAIANVRVSSKELRPCHLH